MRMTYAVVALLLVSLSFASGCQTLGKMKRALFNRSATTQPAREAKSAEAKKAGDPADEDDEAKSKEPQKTLYDRLGGEPVIRALVDDLVARAAADPKVNFTRKGTPHEWPATPDNIARLKARLMQFLGTATGGPQRYEGQDVRTAHRGMQISNAEFDAFAADVKASLDQLKVPEKEQKEVLELIEAARGTVTETAR